MSSVKVIHFCFLYLVGLQLLLLLLLTNTATAIKCYECNSRNRKEASCKDQLPDKKLIVDCSEKKDGAKYNRCRTIRQWVDFKVESLEPDSRVIRKCSWNQTGERPCYYKAGFGGKQEVCTCYTNECNGAMATTITTTTTVMTLAASCGLAFLATILNLRNCP